MKRPVWIAPFLLPGARRTPATRCVFICAGGRARRIRLRGRSAGGGSAGRRGARGSPVEEMVEAPAIEARARPEPQPGLAGLADLPSPDQEGRKIIKNGDMALLVADTDAALDNVTLIAVGQGGYIVSSETEERGGAKYAQVRLGVPVERFEETQRRLRTLAIKVYATMPAART